MEEFKSYIKSKTPTNKKPVEALSNTLFKGLSAYRYQISLMRRLLIYKIFYSYCTGISTVLPNSTVRKDKDLFKKKQNPTNLRQGLKWSWSLLSVSKSFCNRCWLYSQPIKTLIPYRLGYCQKFVNMFFFSCTVLHHKSLRCQRFSPGACLQTEYSPFDLPRTIMTEKYLSIIPSVLLKVKCKLFSAHTLDAT